MVPRLWVPLTHWLWARNWNLAASGACLTASRVARVAVSTPLRIESSTLAVVSVVVIVARLLGGASMGDGWRCGGSVPGIQAAPPSWRRRPIRRSRAGARRGAGRAARAAACLSMAALSCFWSSMNLGTCG